MPASLFSIESLMLILRGLGATILIALLSVLLGTLIGGTLYAMLRSHHKAMRTTGAIYRFIIRGTPVMILLLAIYYVFFSGHASLLAAILAFGISFSTFACGLFQSSIESVGHGQIEAGRSLGLTNMQTYRYVVAPQAVRNALPAFKFQAVNTLKSTAVVGYVAILDLTQATEAIRQGSGQSFVPLAIVTVIYIILAWLLSSLIDLLVKKI